MEVKKGLFAGLIVSSLVLVACGGGGGGSDSSGTGSSSSGTPSSGGGGGGSGGGSGGGGGLGPSGNPSGDSYAAPFADMVRVARASYMTGDGVADSGLTYLDFTNWLLPQLHANGEIEDTPCGGACAPGHDDYQNRVDFACPNGGSASVWHWEDNDSSTTVTVGDDYLVVVGSCSFDDSNGASRTVTLDASGAPSSRGTLNINPADQPNAEYIINGEYVDSGLTARITRDADPLTTYRVRRVDDASERVEISEYDFTLASRDRTALDGDIAGNLVGDAYSYLGSGATFVANFNGVTFSLVGGQPRMAGGSISVMSSETADFVISLAADPAFVTITHAGGAAEVAQQDVFIPLRGID